MIETGRKRVDGESGCRYRGLPLVHPLAVGILSVGILPCGFAAGIAGELPQAGSCEPSVSRRITSAVPPVSATTRAKMSEKFNALFHFLRVAAARSKTEFGAAYAVLREFVAPQQPTGELWFRAPAKVVVVWDRRRSAAHARDATPQGGVELS